MPLPAFQSPDMLEIRHPISADQGALITNASDALHDPHVPPLPEARARQYHVPFARGAVIVCESVSGPSVGLIYSGLEKLLLLSICIS